MALDVSLPPYLNGKSRPLPLCTGSLVIIGANGSGKSRFTAALAAMLGGRAHQVSALRGLYMHDTSSQGEATELDRYLDRLLRDEMANLLDYKLRRTSNPEASLRPTLIDRLIELWQEIYPGRHISVASTRFTFSRHDDADPSPYSASRLSDGERAVLYLAASMLYAPKKAIVLVDSPEMFLHPTVMLALWNRLEHMRPDCKMVYTTHDLEFAASRPGASIVWVRNYDSGRKAWDYDILPPGSAMTDEMYMSIIGARKPVLFIEGDGTRSIDSKLYPLIFKDYTIKPLGSCNKVIEATRTFNDLNSFHHMKSRGIVDRDRRDTGEVEYLRRKNIMVPEVAEIENILLLDEVIRAVAVARGRNENNISRNVQRTIIKMFTAEYKEQALMHTRHRVKRTAEYRIDGRFTSIDQLERHVAGLVEEINPRRLYEQFCREFKGYIDTADYHSILRVYNQKSILPNSGIAGLLGLTSKEAYIGTVISLLRAEGEAAQRIRSAVLECFRSGAETDEI